MRPTRWDEQRPKAEWEKVAERDPEKHWQEKRRVERGHGDVATQHEGILFGSNAAGRAITMPMEMLKTHMHVVGATGVGKSFFLEGIIKDLILQGRGVCLIDPHGDLYHRVFDFCAHVHRVAPELGIADRVIPFDIAEGQQLLGFNPVQRNARIKVYQVVAMMEAVRKCWGQANFQTTPRLARWLFNTLYAVIDSGATFLQTYDLVNPNPNQFRQAITRRITNPRIRAEWEYLSGIKSPEKREDKVESCLSRIRPFVEHDTIRGILGQTTKTINFDSVLSGQKILLVNLARQNVISEDDRHLLGTLLVNELLTATFSRRQGERDPFYLFIDEFQNFVTKDICEILDGGRKFGLHLVLAHQHLNQLKQKDPEVYYSTLTNARTKVVFGGLIDEDLDILAKELYTGELDPDEVKQEIWQTKFRPVETTRIIFSKSESSSESTATSEVSHQSLADHAVYIPGSSEWSVEPLSESFTSGLSAGGGTSESSSRSLSRSQTEVPFYEHHEYQELSSRTFRSLEEQLYIKKAQMKRQGQQHAAVLIPGQHVELLKTPTLREFPVADSIREEFKQTCFALAGCFKGVKEAGEEIRALEESLLVGDSPSTPHGEASREDESFFE